MNNSTEGEGKNLNSTNVTAKNNENENENENENKNENESGLIIKKSKEEEEKEEQKDFGGTSRLIKEYGQKDRWLSVLGLLIAIINGAAFPLFGTLFREIMNALFSGHNIVDKAQTIVGYFVALGSGACVLTVLQYTIFGYYGTNITAHIRNKYFELLLLQDVSYHDDKNSGLLNAKLISNCNAIQEGIGTKYGFFIQQASGFFLGFILAFIYSWQMTLVLLACMPVIMLVGIIQGRLLQSAQKGSTDPFVHASSFSNEVLSNIKTVIAFPSLIKNKVEQYYKILMNAYPISKKKALIIGGGLGFMMFGMFGVMYSIGLWYGTILVDKGAINIGDMFGCYFSFMVGGMALGQMGSVAQNLKDASISANLYYYLLNRRPKMRSPDLDYVRNPIGKQYVYVESNDNNNNNNANNNNNNVPPRLKGKIEFRNVCFTYPNEPNNNILNNVNFTLNPGYSLAIVGPSGSGKSTIVSLIERYYDPNNGFHYVYNNNNEKKKNDDEKNDDGKNNGKKTSRDIEPIYGENNKILIDDIEIHNYDINYLRSQIGYVSQLPLLFDTTIKENIRAGLPNISDNDIIEAAKLADAHDFISALKLGYETLVGEMGGRLSGGQKQRISIARAIVSRPAILLLDEATSALDTKSEKEVQKALDKISNAKQQTIITIAHRLSTIKDADHILVLVNGEIDEQGDHETLMNQHGVYSALVKQQAIVDETATIQSKTMSPQIN